MAINPYVPQSPGDLITAENWNQMQVKIQQDILDKMKKAEDDVKAGTVAKAQDATTLDGKSVAVLTDEYDARYAFKVHDHEGIAAYRRYFKLFTQQAPEALLRHGLHRFPIVDTYWLADVVSKTPKGQNVSDYAGCKFLFFRKHQDADPYGLYVSAGPRDKELIGVPFDTLLTEYKTDITDDDQLEEAIGDFFQDAFMKEPNDSIAYCQTPWVQDCCEKDRTVGDLKHAGEWMDLFIGFRPEKCGMGFPLEGIGKDPCLLTIKQVNYDTIYAKASDQFIGVGKDPQGVPTAVVMFLLRS